MRRPLPEGTIAFVTAFAALHTSLLAAEPAPATKPATFDAPSKDSPAAAWWRDSMKTRDERTGWWREARFGMFIHWGVSSVLGNEYKGRNGCGYAEHIQRFLKIPIPEYRAEVAGHFNPENFNADEWIRMAMVYDAPTDSKNNRVAEGDAGKELVRAHKGASGTYVVQVGSQTFIRDVRTGLNVNESLGKVTLEPGTFTIATATPVLMRTTTCGRISTRHSCIALPNLTILAVHTLLEDVQTDLRIAGRLCCWKRINDLLIRLQRIVDMSPCFELARLGERTACVGRSFKTRHLVARV